MPDDPDELAPVDAKRDIVEDRLIVVVGERNVVEFDGVDSIRCRPRSVVRLLVVRQPLDESVGPDEVRQIPLDGVDRRVQTADPRTEAEHGEQEHPERRDRQGEIRDRDVDQPEQDDRHAEFVEATDRDLIPIQADTGLGVLVDDLVELVEEMLGHPEQLDIADPLRAGLDVLLDAFVRGRDPFTDGVARLDHVTDEIRQATEDDGRQHRQRGGDEERDRGVHQTQKRLLDEREDLSNGPAGVLRLRDDRVQDVVGPLLVVVGDGRAQGEFVGLGSEMPLVLDGEHRRQPLREKRHGVSNDHDEREPEYQKFQRERESECQIRPEEQPRDAVGVLRRIAAGLRGLDDREQEREPDPFEQGTDQAQREHRTHEHRTVASDACQRVQFFGRRDVRLRHIRVPASTTG